MSDRPVVLVTGAARRVGREIALQLAGSGFDVAIHYRGSQADAQATVRDAQAAGAAAAAFQADLSDEAACRALVPAVVAHFKRLDAVVNNASTFEYDTAQTFSHAAMERHWRANTAPAVLLAQALHAHLSGCAEVGCIVNLLDQKLWNPNPDYFSYTLSKAALQAATVMLAQALAPQLRVCGVAPGVTLLSGHDDRRGVCKVACLDAIAAFVDAGRHRPRGAFPDRVAGHHRHHTAGRRRPASAGPVTRCDVHRQPRQIPIKPTDPGSPRACKACSATPA